MSRLGLYNETVRAFEEAGVPDARFDALCIFQDALSDRNPLFKPREEVPPEVRELVRALAERRINGEPLQYVLGEWEFYGFPFKVGEGVLVPRPDTETLVELVLDKVREKGLKAPRIADLCSGSGCIAITLKKLLPEAEVFAVELSEKALAYLRANAELNNADVRIIAGDVLKNETRKALSGLDVIVSNPPYLTAPEMRSLQREVAFEPALALFGGEDGLGFYRAITELWRSSLKMGGLLAYELGDGQAEAVRRILLKHSFGSIEFRRDGGGLVRAASAVKNGDRSFRDAEIPLPGDIVTEDI